MTINNKSERNYQGKCLGWPVTSYGGEDELELNSTEILQLNFKYTHVMLYLHDRVRDFFQDGSIGIR